jgi:hypothetical protein
MMNGDAHKSEERPPVCAAGVLLMEGVMESYDCTDSLFAAAFF